MYISRGQYPPIIENQMEDNMETKWTDSRTPAESPLASSDKNEVPDSWL